MLKKSILPLAGVALAFAGVAPALAADPSASETIAAATLHWTQEPLAQANAAQDPVLLPVPAVQAAANPAQTSATDKAAQDDKDLDGMSGRGTDVAVGMTEQALSAVNTGNTINATTLVTGAINLQDNALSNFAGIGNILMNTGANNNMQSTIIVTVVITK